MMKKKPTLRLFNSQQRKKVSFLLSSKEKISLYLCGPTVYDHVHVGNLRSVIIFDLLVRLLRFFRVKVSYAQNITDIDDKIITRAEKEAKNERDVSEFYTTQYFQILSHFHIHLPDFSPRVTKNIDKIKLLIADLLHKGYAYFYQGDVLFRLNSISDYGVLSHQRMDELRKKKEFGDFVLWKRTNRGISWNSEWGQGRPGWHSECVSFIDDIFNRKTIDIHGGGRDLIFPHHENERAQFVARNVHELTRCWLHVSYVKWDGVKMSKSLENTFYAKDFYFRYGSDVLKHIFFATHYRQTINLNKALIHQSLAYIKRVISLKKRISFYLNCNNFCLFFVV